MLSIFLSSIYSYKVIICVIDTFLGAIINSAAPLPVNNTETDYNTAPSPHLYTVPDTGTDNRSKNVLQS
jgi:hypothetical protein